MPRRATLSGEKVVVVDHGDARAFRPLAAQVRRQGPALCGKAFVRAQFLRAQVDRADVIAAVLHHGQQGTQVAPLAGFALVEIDPPMQSAEITLICAQSGAGRGSRLIDAVSEWLEQRNQTLPSRQQIGQLTVAALPPAIAFYRKQHFGLSRKCDGETRAAAQLASKVSNKRFASDAAALEDQDMARLLRHLVRQGLAHNPDCRGIAPSPTTQPTQPDCSEDGYDMSRCLSRR